MNPKPPIVAPDEESRVDAVKVGPHLGLMDGETGAWTGIPVGSMMAIIIDPRVQTKILPLVLVDVKFKRLTFKCACGQRGCSRLYHFHATMTGNHPVIAGR